MKKWAEQYGGWFFPVLLFGVMMIYFYQVHPFILFDGDDWRDMGGARNVALPKWHDWNPSKVMPESLMPLVGYLGAYVFSPLLGDYLHGISLAVACVAALAVTAYTVLLKDVLERRFGLSTWLAAGGAGIFLLMHFLVFKNSVQGNVSLFTTPNVDCFFHYNFSFLLNASIVLYLISRNITSRISFRAHPFWSAGLFFALYLAVFSNILHSIVLICYIAFQILHELEAEKAYRPRRVLLYLKSHRFYSGIILVWLLSLLFEADGGRARSIGTPNGAPFFVALGKVFHDFSAIFLSEQKGILIIFVALGLFALPALYLALFRQEKDVAVLTKEYLSLMKMTLFSLFLWASYELLICAKANAGYIGRSDVLCGWFFFLFLMMMGSLAYLLRRKTGLALVFPVLFFVVLCRTTDGRMGYVPSTYARIPETTCYAVSNDFVQQFRRADEAGGSEFDLHVPYSATPDNWPFFPALGEHMERQLYSHGVISRHMKVNFVIDEALNEKYHLDSLR